MIHLSPVILEVPLRGLCPLGLTPVPVVSGLPVLLLVRQGPHPKARLSSLTAWR